LRRIYDGVAGDVWAQLAAEFNQEVDRLNAAAGAVDISLPMAEVFDKPKKTQEVWAEGNSALARLTALVTPLHTAAKLAGVCGNSRDDVLRLLVDHEDHLGEDVRRIGFDWLELRNAGISIRAVARLEDAKPWTEPAPESAGSQRPSDTDIAWLRTAGMADGWDYLGTEYDPSQS
jgi:hypothetical protein